MVMVVATAGLVCFVALPAALRAALGAARATWRARRPRGARERVRQPRAAGEGEQLAAALDAAAAPPADAASCTGGRLDAAHDLESGAGAPKLSKEGAPAAVCDAASAAAARRRALLVSAGVASGIGLLVALQVRRRRCGPPPPA